MELSKEIESRRVRRNMGRREKRMKRLNQQAKSKERQKNMKRGGRGR